jgi:hypothetical protein
MLLFGSLKVSVLALSSSITRIRGGSPSFGCSLFCSELVECLRVLGGMRKFDIADLENELWC